jgi:CubicO group peptidase (beta-lactamase class C family)
LEETEPHSRNVTKDSIYRIGGITEVFTVWSLLLLEGDQIFNDPVVKYLPELANTSPG